ncbi:hypothetical protein M3204_03575 [Mesobacillus subterraneus]|uniref:hypothetical protein n=1 Tax=Mesobacillus subterraneus TaxID=285983 RepID=UPI00203D6CA0|nr:hypothetical protein [Mesobacillus subterraneus]MCM3663467.1 hypothetical protein [Mesobacillus subterraneus]MCM3683237.1 hypothetical protein [Mesobacillus subterraneus]
MDKIQLLEVISVSKQQIKSLAKIRKEYREYHIPNYNVAKLPLIVKLILGYFLFTLVATPIPFLAALGGYFVIVVFGLIAIFATIYLYITLEEKINLYQIKKKTIKHADRIKEIIEEEKSLMEFLESLNLPLDYCYPSAVGQFESYLLNQRADSLKECINLYEQEKQHQNQINELRTIQQIQELTLEEARTAKNIAIFSLFARR